MKIFPLPAILLIIGLLCGNLPAGAQHTWYWHNPSGDGNHLNDLCFPSAGEGWAVGNGGKLLHYIGTRWSMYDRITFQDLNALWFTDENHGWAVGNHGTLLRYSNGDWIQENAGTTRDLYDVCFPSPDNGWAVGQVRMHYDGTAWTTLDTLGYGGVTEVCFTDPDHGWCGGFMQFYRYDQTGWHWNPLVSSDILDIRSLFFYDADHGWIGGVYSDGMNFIMNYDGSSWSWAPSNPPCTSNDLHFDNPEHGWSCGGQTNWFWTDTTVFEFDGNRWTGSYVNPGTPNALAPGSAGQMYVATEWGHILRHDASGWDYSNTLAEGRIDLSFPDTAHGWLAGDGKYILRYHHGTLAPDTSFGEVNIRHIHFADTNHGIAAGWSNRLHKTFLYRYSSSGWQLITDTLSVPIGVVCALPDGGAWLAADYVSGGARVYLLSGNSMITYYFPDLRLICSLSFTDPSHGWGIARKSPGFQYAIIRYQLGSWTEEMAAPPDQVMQAVSFCSPNSGWAVGYSSFNMHGVSYHFDGSTWTPGPESTGGLINVCHPDPEHVYAIGSSELFTLSGDQWLAEPVTTIQNLVSLAVSPDGTGWIGCSQGGILSTRSPFAVGVTEPAYKQPGRDFTITPNPASGYTRLLFNSRGEGHPQAVHVTDLFGRPVRKHRLLQATTDFRLDLAGLSRGMYLVEVIRNNGAATRGKLVVK